MDTVLYALITAFSNYHQVDPNLTAAIIHTESRFNQNAVGSLGEVGLMQIRPEHVPESRKQLLNPIVNVFRGTQMLANAKEKCKHKIDKTFVVCYNAGIVGGSRLSNPKTFKYYQKVHSTYLYYKRRNLWKQFWLPHLQPVSKLTLKRI